MNSPAIFRPSDASALINTPHPHLDLDDQMFAVDAHKGKAHNEWVQGHASKAVMDHACSRVKALLLVKEAERLELIHLEHQRDHANFLLQRCKSKASSRNGLSANNNSNSSCDQGCSCFSPSRHTPSMSPPRSVTAVAASPDAVFTDMEFPSSASKQQQDSSVSPSRRLAAQSFQDQNNNNSTNDNRVHRVNCPKHTKNCSDAKNRSRSSPPPPSPVACGCLHVAAWRLMTPRCRVMALLKKHGEKGNLESIVDALRQTYTSDTEMIEDMDARYGPEPTVIDPELLLISAVERMESHKARWRAIREDVDGEMCSSPHAFNNVIRTLSVMRIFIEGSQGQSYGIDFTDRQRREAAQQAVLAKLRANRALFMDQCNTEKNKDSTSPRYNSTSTSSSSKTNSREGSRSSR